MTIVTMKTILWIFLLHNSSNRNVFQTDYTIYFSCSDLAAAPMKRNAIYRYFRRDAQNMQHNNMRGIIMVLQFGKVQFDNQPQ